MPHFECGAFNHSATSPGAKTAMVRRVAGGVLCEDGCPDKALNGFSGPITSDLQKPHPFRDLSSFMGEASAFTPGANKTAIFKSPRPLWAATVRACALL